MKAALAAVIAMVGACRSDEPVGDVSGVLFGAAVSTGSSDATGLEAAFIGVESETGRHFDLDRIYHQWDDAVPGVREQWTIAMGRTPVISFKSTTVPWASIANGDADPMVVAIANGFAALDAPTFAIFDQDPENAGSDLGSPSDYAAAYRHIVGVFRTAGVTDVVWIFNLKSPSFPDLADAYYPGDDVIDWIGTSAYNYGVTDGGRWVSFADLIADYVAWATPHGKPMFVTEWASEEDTSTPGRKAAWISDAETTTHGTPQIRAMSAYWSMTDATAFDTTASALDAFRAFAADPYTNLR
jgi:hypothetical protein